MNLPSQSVRLRIYLGESDTWEHRPLYEALVLKAREMGLAGATVFRSPMGFGANSRIHTTKMLNLSTDLPLVLELIDAEDKIRAYAEVITPMLNGGLIALEPVTVLHYRHSSRE